MRVNIWTPEEDVIELQVDKSYTFWQLKALIGAYQGYPPEDIKIMSLDNPSDNNTLESEGIRECSYIMFGVICHGMYPINEEKFSEYFNQN